MKSALSWLAALGLLAWQLYAVDRLGAEFVQGRVYVVTAVVAVVFMALYARDPWYKTLFGRSLMLIAFAVFLIGASVVLYRVFGPDYWGRSVLIIVAADAALVAMVLRTVVLWRAQRGDEKHGPDPRP